MNLREYQLAALRTWSPDPDQTRRVLNACLGLSGEVGEVTEPLKKHFFHGKSLDVGEFGKELGDVLYYISVLANEYGLDLEDVARANIRKLEKRWPNKFGDPA